jgi:AGZA family xanthine/uracil permease-like MFS transporter
VRVSWLQITKGDWDGFFGLGLNNFINLLLIISLSQSVLGFSEELIVFRVLPGMAIGLFFGNLYYSWQARDLARKTGRTDVCALPYGINLLPIFFYTFYVMLPAQQIALAGGADKLEADKIAWMAGVLAGIGSGLIELLGAYFAPYLKKITPRAALLSALAAIGLFFITADYTFRAYAYPIIGLPTLFLTMYLLYGSVKMRWNLPAGLIVLAVGISIAWITYWLGMPSPVQDLKSSTLSLGLYIPLPYGLEALLEIRQMLAFAAVIIPMGLINLIGSLQCLESASAAGDDYPIKSSLAVNGIGTLIASGFGSPFPTTIFFGHPGWKALGAGPAYSLMNGVAMAALCLTGTLGLLSEYIPIEAGMAILIWIGFSTASQAFQVVPRSHVPAVIAGILPGIGAFCALIVKRVLGAVGYGTPEQPYTAGLIETLTREGNLYAMGLFALEQGWIYTSVVFASITVAIIDKQFFSFLGWLAAAGVLSVIGIIHNFNILDSDITTKLGPAWNWVWGYTLTLLVLALVRFSLVLGHTENKSTD